MASEIPEDIHARSNEVIAKVFGDGYFDPPLFDAIATALLAERERAAKILEAKASAMRGSVTGDLMARIFEAEAAAIRQQPPHV